MSKFYKGRLTRDPELRFTQGGSAVANFSFVTSTRTFDRQTNQWKDDNVTFYGCEVWGALGEWVAENLKKGVGVFLEGDTRTEEYTDAQGNKRSSIKIKVYDINLSPKMNPAQFNLKQNSPQGGGAQNNAPANNGGSWSTPQPDPWANGGNGGGNAGGNPDPWATGGNSGGNAGWESTKQDDPPF